MDKIKQNLFAISVAAVGLVLLVLAYLLVLGTYQSLNAKHAEMESKTKDLNSQAKQKPFPIAKVKDKLEEEKAAKVAALNDAKAFYASQAAAYHQYFDGATEPQPLSTFASMYNDSIAKLVTGYRDKFGIQVEAGQEDQAPPKVSKKEVGDDAAIQRAMKEYWIVEEVFKACEKLEIRGLRAVEFPARDAVVKDPPPYWNVVVCSVEMDVPFSKIENFLTELYSSKTVPIILEELVCKKTPEGVGQFLALERSVLFKSGAEASAKTYDEVVPEPPVLATFKLHAIDWKGVPEAAEKSSTEKTPPR